MADNTITFSIGSIFKGEGFQKARAAVLETNKAVRQSTQVVSLLASNLGMLDAKYAKATNAITGMLTALSTGNPILAAVQVSMVALAAIMEKLKSKADKLKEAVELQAQYVARMRDALVAAYNDEQAKRMEKHLSIIASIGKEFDEITRAANEFTAAMNKLDATRDAGGLIQMQIDKLQAVANSSGANAGLIAAQKDYEIALRQNAIREKRAGEAIDAANKARLDAQNKVATANSQIFELDYQYQQNLERLNDAGELDARIREQLVADNKAIAEKRKAIEAERDKAEAAIRTAEYAVKQADEEMANAIMQGKLDRIKAQQAVVDAEDAVAKELEKEREEIKQRREKERADLTTKLRAAEGAQNAAKNALAAAQGGNGGTMSVADALAAWNKNINQNLVNERIKDFIRNGGLDQIADRLNLQSAEDQAAAAAAAVDAGIKDGTIRTAAQAREAERAAARAQRDYASSKQARQEAQDERAREQLQKEADRAAATGRKLDPRKQAELDRLNNIKAGKDAAKAALDAAKQAEAKARQDLAKTARETELIRKKLDALGLK